MSGLDEQYDAIVVGARIAGSATAIGLARRGWPVLLLDAATFPSDTLSTHLLWSDALRDLAHLDLLPAVLATGAPPLEAIDLIFGDHINEAPIPALHGYPPLISVRRIVLDEILARRAARIPGVTLHEGFVARELLRDGERVVGVRGVRRGSATPIEIRAPLVIGADGRHSFVARTVGAADYDVVPPIFATYYRYYRDVAPRAVPTLEAFRDPDGGFIYLFPNDGDFWTLVVSVPQTEYERIRRDHERQLEARLAREARVRARLARARPSTPWRGAGDLTNRFRVPFGPGWALVGDAGYHRDPITARGIADALASARLLVDALDATPGGPLGRYQAARDALVQPLYDFTVERPPAGVTPDAWREHLGRTLNDPAFLSDYIGFMAGVTAPEAFYSAEAVRRG